jgi:hypothetical protein
MPLDVLVPQDLQGDVLVLQLAVYRGKIRLGATAVTLLGANRRKEPRFEAILSAGTVPSRGKSQRNGRYADQQRRP